MTAISAPLARPYRDAARPIAVWLLATAGMVFAMTVIGAITRLTESGLSMVEWRPLIGALPPLTEAEWQRVFNLYRETPEYRIKNAGMSLAQFQEIFFWEWLHRLWGRLIGLAFALPLLWFWASGALGTVRHVRFLRMKLLGLLALGALQGGMGWFMVQSGLVDRPSVSQYRLALHLGLAFVIYGLLVWLALDLLDRRPRAAAPRFLRRLATGSVGLLAVTVVWGALVAGLDAGLAYNTWPLMAGRFLPPEGWAITPSWLNLFENTALVQFVHRWLGVGTALAVLLLWWAGRRAAPTGRARALLGLGLGMAGLQVGLGIAALLAQVPVWLGAAHQAGAVLLFTLLVWITFELRERRPPATPELY